MASLPVPTSSPHAIIAGAMIIALGGLCVGTAALLIHRQRRRSARELDVEASIKSDQTARATRTSSCFGKLSGDLQLPARVKIAASSRLRDSVLGRAIGQLSWPEAGKLKVSHSWGPRCSTRLDTKQRTPLSPIQEEQVVDIEATAGLDKSTDVVEDAASETTMSFPQWVRPHLTELREQAHKEWSIYVPGTGLVAASSLQTTIAVPDIIVQSPTEPQLPTVGSAESIYSQESWDGDHAEAFGVAPTPWTPELDASSVASSPDIDSPVLETPTMESYLPLQATLSPAVSKADMSTEASFYWPHLPSFSAIDHLQVPPSTWNGPVREEPDVETVSMSSGKPFMLHSPASAHSRRSTIVLGQVPSAGNVGLGLTSGPSGTLSLSPSSSLSEALDLWAQEMDAYACAYEPSAFRVVSDSQKGLAYDDTERTVQRHSVHGYEYF